MATTMRGYLSNAGTRFGAIAACAQLVLTIPLAIVLNVWQDDAYTLFSTDRGLGYAFHQAIGFEQNAPLYFVVMTLWRHVDGGAVFARMFSVLCAASTEKLIPPIVERYAPQIA